MKTLASATPAVAVGDHITLLQMDTSYAEGDRECLAPNSTGKVTHVTHCEGPYWKIDVQWDDDRAVSLMYPDDKFEATVTAKAQRVA